MTCGQSPAPSHNIDRLNATSKVNSNLQEESDTDSEVILKANNPNVWTQTAARDADFDGKTKRGSRKKQGSAEQTGARTMLRDQI